jgi:hypothetical protein
MWCIGRCVGIVLPLLNRDNFIECERKLHLVEKVVEVEAKLHITPLSVCVVNLRAIAVKICSVSFGIYYVYTLVSNCGASS